MIALPENAIAPTAANVSPLPMGLAATLGEAVRRSPLRSASRTQGALDVVVVSVQPPPSTLYSVTWFCACPSRAASASV